MDVVLKDGREVKLDVWDHSKLEDYVSQVGEDLENYPGFRYFCYGSIMININGLNFYDYDEAENLSDLEILNEEKKSRTVEYSKAVVAQSQDEKLVGIIYCHWQREIYKEFWRYFLRYLDIQKGFREVGLATQMLRFLDNADFLDQKILLLSKFEEGFIAKTFMRELKAKNYSLIPPWINSYELPKKVGVYS